MPTSHAPSLRLARWLVIASLPLWLAAASLAFWSWTLQREAPECPDAAVHCRGLSTDAQIAEEYGLQRIGGKAMVFMVRFERWSMTWLEAPRLQALLSALSLLSALGLVLRARALQTDADSTDRADPRDLSDPRLP